MSFICSGRREWSIENSFLSKEDEKQRAVPRVDTKLLKDFRADQTWELETGDMLYLPPRVPHRGREWLVNFHCYEAQCI